MKVTIDAGTWGSTTEPNTVEDALDVISAAISEKTISVYVSIHDETCDSHANSESTGRHMEMGSGG